MSAPSSSPSSAIFDLLFLIVCKAGAKAACSLGITDAITKLITDWIYTGSVMIDTTGDPAITNVEDIEMRLTDPELGPVVGNSMRYRRRPTHLWSATQRRSRVSSITTPASSPATICARRP